MLNLDDVLKDYGVIKHIPHASISFPNNSGVRYNMSTNLKLSDLFIDILFKDIKGLEIKALYSRLYCDVEKYQDNSLEEMYRFGMGYIYTKDIFTGEDIKRNHFDKEKNKIDEYYQNHHNRLLIETRKILAQGKKVLILDLHSFSEKYASLIGQKGPYPNICIGVNSNQSYDSKILELIINIIKEKGYSYQINYPFSGAMTPNGLTDEEKDKVTSIMLEVNKRIYL